MTKLLLTQLLKTELDQHSNVKVVRRIYHKRYEGFNRADGSIIEACILASRVKILNIK